MLTVVYCIVCPYSGGLYLVGSWARDDADDASDVDVLFMGFDERDLDLVITITAFINMVSPSNLDAIDSAHIPPTVLKSMLSDALFIWPN